MRVIVLVFLSLLVSTLSCSSQDVQGIADKRSDFGSFLPMKANATRDGLRTVKPYFRRPDRAGVIHAIEKACAGGRRGSSVYDAKTGAGYYVNCNPKNRQLLNGYVAAEASRQPHSK